MENKCKGCKHYREGLDIDYVPGHYCDIGVKNREGCTRYDNHITFTDWLSECWLGIVAVVIWVILNLVCR